MTPPPQANPTPLTAMPAPSREEIAHKLLVLAGKAEQNYQLENAIWATVEASRTLGYTVDE